MADETKTDPTPVIPVETVQPPVPVEAPVPTGTTTPTAPPPPILSFFVQPTDRHRITLDILYNKDTKLITSVSKAGLGIDFSKFDTFGHVEEWFEFSLPNYEDLSTYRQRCSSFRRDANRVVVDETQLKNFLLVWHLKDWSLVGQDGKKVTLNCNPEGALDDESIKKVYTLPPTLIEVLLTNLEKDLILT